MATKELDIIVKVNGKDVDVAKMSTKELTQQIQDLRTKLSEAPLGSKEFKQLNDDINSLEQGFRKAKDAGQPFLESMGQLEGALGYLGRTIKGVGEAFDLLVENPLVAAMGAIAGATVLAAEQMEKFGGVTESLKVTMDDIKLTGDGVLHNFFAPLAQTVQDASNWFSDLLEKYKEFKGLSGDTGKSTKESLEDLVKEELKAGNTAIELSKARAALTDAREKLNDPNINKEEKQKAITDAAEAEKKTTDLIIEAAFNKAKDNANLVFSINDRLGSVSKENFQDIIKKSGKLPTKDELDKLQEIIKNSIELNKYAEAQDQFSEPEIKRLQGVQTLIAAINDENTRYSTAQRRLNSLNSSLNKKETKELTAEQKLAQEQKDNFDKLGLELRNKIRIENAKDEIDKLRASTKNEENTMLEEINKAKLNKNQRKQILDLYNEYVVAKETETAKKVDEIDEKMFDKHLKEVEQVKSEEVNVEKQRYEAYVVLYGKESDEAKKQLDYVFDLREKNYNDELNLLYDRASAGYNLTNEELLQIEKLKAALKTLGIERQKSQGGQNDIIPKFELETKKLQNEYLKRKKFTTEYYNAEKDAIKKSMEANDKKFKNNEITEKEYLANKEKLTAAEIKLDDDKTKSQEENLKIIGDAFGMASKLAGENTAEGKALAIAQATIDTYAAANKALDTYVPPFSYIAAATTIAAGLLNVQKIMSVDAGGSGGGSLNGPVDRNSTAGKAGYAEGGLITGKSHSEGGVNINAQGGEAIMTRGAVTMFGPLLSKLNQAGGGTPFNKAMTGMARPDNPKTPGNPLQDQPIIKTYVVANELNTIQHKQARLKDLSTL